MLFYMKYEEKREVEKIPSSYLAINLSNKKKIIAHPNSKNISILPELDYKKIDAKDKFRKDLITKYREHLTVLANYLIKSHAANSLVIVCDKKLCDKIGFNPAKLICEMIEKRYEYKTYKFTYDVLPEMLRKSKFSKKGLTNLIKDMDSLRENV